MNVQHLDMADFQVSKKQILYEYETKSGLTLKIMKQRGLSSHSMY